ncbi:nucleotide pyrophosphohydrolase [Janibacter sp. G1551]|uniref:nucleotide pyrophosphohydrolase n=1 Tax=Janibacter sp. G1551 TaxID=3420440 RepID=UPI003D021805
MDTDAWQDRIRQFTDERDWHQFHTPKNLAMALSVETSELVEIFQWLTPDEAADIMASDRGDAVRDEIADVLSYLLRLADVLDIDLDAALESKTASNARRYPADTARGSIAKAGPDPLTLASPEPVVVIEPVLGACPCAGGWVGALLTPAAPRPQVLTAPDLDGLIELALQSEAVTAVAVVTVPAAAAPASSAPAGERPGIRVMSVEAEAAFADLAGALVPGGRATPTGDEARLAILERAKVGRPSIFAGSDYTTADVLDACAAACAAVRGSTGR